MKRLSLIGLILSMNASAQIGRDTVYIDNGIVRAGVSMESGGGISWFSESRSRSNLLNTYDRGRLLQQSYYGNEDGSRWGEKPWRYNPVQGGDYLKNGSRVLSWKKEGTRIYCVTRPRNWGGTGELPECVMEEWVELYGDMMRVRFRFLYNGKIAHKARNQETPALFVNPSLDVLYTYDGGRPWRNGGLTKLKPGTKNQLIHMTENWAAWINGETDRGLGIYTPGSDSAACYRFRGAPGTDCSYIAPLSHFALTSGTQHVYDVWLTVGGVKEIRGKIFSLIRNQNRPLEGREEEIPKAIPVDSQADGGSRWKLFGRP